MMAKSSERGRCILAIDNPDFDRKMITFNAVGAAAFLILGGLAYLIITRSPPSNAGSVLLVCTTVLLVLMSVFMISYSIYNRGPHILVYENGIEVRRESTFRLSHPMFIPWNRVNRIDITETHRGPLIQIIHDEDRTVRIQPGPGLDTLKMNHMMRIFKHYSPMRLNGGTARAKVGYSEKVHLHLRWTAPIRSMEPMDSVFITVSLGASGAVALLFLWGSLIHIIYGGSFISSVLMSSPILFALAVGAYFIIRIWRFLRIPKTETQVPCSKLENVKSILEEYLRESGYSYDVCEKGGKRIYILKPYGLRIFVVRGEVCRVGIGGFVHSDISRAVNLHIDVDKLLHKNGIGTGAVVDRIFYDLAGDGTPIL